MNFSVHSGVEISSSFFGALVWGLVSSVALYVSKSNGYRNILVFCFQVKREVFALGTAINGDYTFHTMLQEDIF